MYSLFYIILTLQSIKNKSCEQRYLFKCYENSTIYEIDDSGLENSIKSDWIFYSMVVSDEHFNNNIYDS